MNRFGLRDAYYIEWMSIPLRKRRKYSLNIHNIIKSVTESVEGVQDVIKQYKSNEYYEEKWYDQIENQKIPSRITTKVIMVIINGAANSVWSRPGLVKNVKVHRLDMPSRHLISSATPLLRLRLALPHISFYHRYYSYGLREIDRLHQGELKSIIRGEWIDAPIRWITVTLHSISGALFQG